MWKKEMARFKWVGASGRREERFWVLVFFEALQKPIQSARPLIVPVQTLQMNFLSPVWLQTQSCRRGRDHRSCSFPLIHTNTAAEEPSLSDNSLLKHDRSLSVGTSSHIESVHNSCTLWSDVKPVLIDFWTEILSLHSWLKPLQRQNASVKQLQMFSCETNRMHISSVLRAFCFGCQVVATVHCSILSYGGLKLPKPKNK